MVVNHDNEDFILMVCALCEWRILFGDKKTRLRRQRVQAGRKYDFTTCENTAVVFETMDWCCGGMGRSCPKVKELASHQIFHYYGVSQGQTWNCWNSISMAGFHWPRRGCWILL